MLYLCQTIVFNVTFFKILSSKSEFSATLQIFTRTYLDATQLLLNPDPDGSLICSDDKTLITFSIT